MSYQATAHNVMIASPGDVQSERNIVREVIHEWNAIHSESRRIILMPLGWESHASPEMGVRPQQAINEQVLNRCDLLIGIFWTRIGTTTGEYTSGTVEEIERHTDAQRPAMLYFSNQPVLPDSIDPDQYGALKQFKASCQSKGLYETYESLSDFRAKFYRHLQLKLNDARWFPQGGSGPELDPNIFEFPKRDPTLSKEAQQLLVEASEDSNGVILYLRYLNGTQLQTNAKNLIPSDDRRTVAKWESALQELVDEQLVIGRGHKGEVFEITTQGYSLADVLKGRT